MLGRFGIRAFPLAPLAFFLAFLLGTSFASKKNVDKSISYKGRPICTTEKCFKVAVSLYGAMSKKANVDPCENWDEFACGGYDEQDLHELNMEKDINEVNVKTVVKQGIMDMLDHVVVTPDFEDKAELRPHGVDKLTFERMRRYYKTCMDWSPSERAGLTPLRKIIQQFHNIWSDAETIYTPIGHYIDAVVNRHPPAAYSDLSMGAMDRPETAEVTRILSDYGIWVFARFAPQQSLFNSSEMRIGIQPWIAPGLPERRMYDNSDFYNAYKSFAERILKTLSRPQWENPSWTNMGKNLVDFEWQLWNITPPAEQLRDVQSNTVLWTSAKLEEVAPDIGLRDVLRDLPITDKKKLDELEVFLPDYLLKLNKIITKTPRHIIRGYIILKTFQQTYDLLDAGIADNYRSVQRKISGAKNEPSLEKKCKARVSEHFGPIVGSVLINHTFIPEALAEGHKMFADIRTELIRTLNDTEWMFNETKEAAIEKASKAEAMIGFPQKNPNLLDWEELRQMFAGAAVKSWESPQDWTHMDDYLQMQRWYTRRGWIKDMSRPPNKYKWLIDAYDTETYYSHQLNRVVIPAGTMVPPMFDVQLPSYVNYGALGTFMGTELMHGFDSIGNTFSLNGTMDPQFAERDQQRYDERAQCFFDKYEGMELKTNDKKKLTFNVGPRLDSIIADTHGVDLAYYAWKAGKHKDQMVPGHSQYTDDQMFFLIRSLFHCSKERPQVLRNDIGHGMDLPKRVRSWAPLEDSWAWQKAFKCKPKKKVCRIYGEDENPGKYIKLTPSQLNGTANETANVTEPWNPDKYYYIPDEDEDEDGKKDENGEEDIPAEYDEKEE
ncbi:hypothetical protein B0T10DRAFT_458610 [Thelonectria olida]|uniref:Uncharacterized protein n=1 Tax=Thelonectria olida TaxID=1576542 RepID=A0A9P8W6V6_9HYPO|nr:hypothetical protein B0T10DRAFT_458610 [Thelonectria olida]